MSVELYTDKGELLSPKHLLSVYLEYLKMPKKMKFQPSNLAIVLNEFSVRLLHITEDQIKKSVKMNWKIK